LTNAPKIYQAGVDCKRAVAISKKFARSHDEMIACFRQRIVDLDISYATAEDLAGFQVGYLGKVLNLPPSKRIGPFFAFMLSEALGLRLQFVEDPELTAKMRHRWTKRRLARPGCGT
jgi:hypothetical protein